MHMPSGSTGHKLRYSWDDVAGTVHQMMARARREREGYSWTSRSIGVSNGRHVLPEGACRAGGVGVRYVVIPCTRKRQNPGRAPRAWGRSLARVCAPCSPTLPDARHDLHTVARCSVSLPSRHVSHPALLSAPCSGPERTGGHAEGIEGGLPR